MTGVQTCALPIYDDIFAAYDSAYILSILGGHYDEAEQLVTQPFKIARQHYFSDEVFKRLPQITEFYKYMQGYNWTPRRPINNRTKRDLIFPVTAVKYISKDSAILTIAGGSIEGLESGMEIQALGTKLPFLSADSNSNVLGTGKLTKVTDNTATVLFRQSYTSDSSDNVYPNDVIFCSANAVYDNDLGDYQFLADKKIAFMDNSRQEA